LLYIADTVALSLAQTIAKQGRLAEAEAEMRRALLSRLREQGKYHALTPRFIMGLASILVEQGRYIEAEQLARVALEITRVMGIAPDSQATAKLLLGLGSILSLQDKTVEAAAVFAELDQSIAAWDSQRRRRFELDDWRVHALYGSGQIDAGIAASRERLELTTSRMGEKHYDTAAARGILAIGYVKASRFAEAATELSTAIPILIAEARGSDDDDNMTGVLARQRRMQNFIEAYITAIAASRSDVANQTFSLAEIARSQSVQQALAASSARMLAKDPALTELIRSEQDLSKQVHALLGTLNNALSLPAGERDESVVAALRGSIAATRTERDQAKNEIARRFPDYAELIDPKPPTVGDIQSILRSDEALLSFYFGYHKSFVWAVSKNGSAVFAAIEMTARELQAKVDRLRTALEPKAAMIADIPPFDVALARELYDLLLKPVESAWQPAKSLVVATNGALGLLPLALLPTAPAKLSASEKTLFASYRQVPWLARSHAVTTVPSAAALLTLRKLPPGSSKREAIIGFGDPLFSAEQALETASAPMQVASAAGRGLPLRRRLAVQTRDVDSADLALLPRLPDTATELRSIARALQRDPSQVLFLGKQANEHSIKTRDLSQYRIVAFSTHGLLPGDLDGLTQPALALSAPDVAGVEGDGLLTMEEILPLKLDADWVVLSACNTGVGAGAGAEAASGLGRAFFYAGSRSLLVTNWSVHSASATELVTGIFSRQAAGARLTRGEALRQSMLALMDGPGSVGPGGQTEYTYAHPLFWAPYTIIGDGG
jgi:CHAT domain-containing protein